MPARTRRRCAWARSELAVAYHDREWGVPVHDDRLLLEFLILEGAQAGLSWELILKRRDGYRKAFRSFDPRAIARLEPAAVGRLMNDERIVRNRLKIESAIRNARVFLEIQRENGSFDAYLWRFVSGRPIQNRWGDLRELPASTAEAEALSRDLRRRGMRFVGPTICYAFMQAVGMVNDHTTDCFRHKEVKRMAQRPEPKGRGV